MLLKFSTIALLSICYRTSAAPATVSERDFEDLCDEICIGYERPVISNRKALKLSISSSRWKPSNPNPNNPSKFGDDAFIGDDFLSDDNFHDDDEYNQSPIACWDVSRVTDFYHAFRDLRGQSEFNQPLNCWDTSSATDMRGMFEGAAAFNQPLDHWNTSSVRDMTGMFDEAHAFNQPLDDWDTLSVVDMSYMFAEAEAFNQCLSTWPSKGTKTDTLNMFSGSACTRKETDEDIWCQSADLCNASFELPDGCTAPISFLEASCQSSGKTADQLQAKNDQLQIKVINLQERVKSLIGEKVGLNKTVTDLEDQVNNCIEFADQSLKGVIVTLQGVKKQYSPPRKGNGYNVWHSTMRGVIVELRGGVDLEDVIVTLEGVKDQYSPTERESDYEVWHSTMRGVIVELQVVNKIAIP